MSRLTWTKRDHSHSITLFKPLLHNRRIHHYALQKRVLANH